MALFMRNYPSDRGLAPYGPKAIAPPTPLATGGFSAAFDGLRIGSRVPAFCAVGGQLRNLWRDHQRADRHSPSSPPPSLLSPRAAPSMWVSVLFYGLDWVATVPPTIVLRREHFGDRSHVVFGWVFAPHQLGAAVAAAGAGWLRDLNGSYDVAFYLAAGLCFVAATFCSDIRKVQVGTVKREVEDTSALP